MVRRYSFFRVYAVARNKVRICEHKVVTYHFISYTIFMICLKPEVRTEIQTGTFLIVHLVLFSISTVAWSTLMNHSW